MSAGETVTVDRPYFGVGNEPAKQLVDAAWRMRNGYYPGGSTTVAAVAKLCQDAASAINPAVRTHYEDRYPARDTGPEVDVSELTYEERVALPARFHRPHFMDLSTPSYWMCTACWDGDTGLTTGWPCKPATAGGLEVARACGLEFSA